MLNSMTGFASREAKVLPLGTVCVELRSTNHKFLDTVYHLPEGFLSLEDKIKKGLEAKIKRGRVTCVINIVREEAPRVFINEPLLENYIAALKNIRRRFKIQDEPGLDTLIHLPGILSLTESKVPKEQIWPRLNLLVNQALDDLVKTRQKEGQALYIYLKSRAGALNNHLEIIKRKARRVVKEKCRQIKTDEERSSFLKQIDISEEIERLVFHIKNFIGKLSKPGPIGKELDFIAQEMQREANTIGAKSCSAAISGRVVQMKSQIEKIREQVQNIE